MNKKDIYSICINILSITSKGASEMKKSGIFMVIISIVFLFFVNEHYRYDGYKEVEIPNIGIAKVPESWYCGKTKDGYIYFANMPIENEGAKVYLIQHSIKDYSLDKNQSESGHFLEDYHLGDVISIEKIFVSPYGNNNVYSNGCRYQSCNFYLNNIKVDSYYIDFVGNNSSSIFFIVDDSIDIKTMEDMTKWFEKY